MPAQRCLAATEKGGGGRSKLIVELELRCAALLLQKRPLVTVAILAQGTNRAVAVTQAFCAGRRCMLPERGVIANREGTFAHNTWRARMSASVGGRSQADRLERNTAMDDSIGGS